MAVTGMPSMLWHSLQCQNGKESENPRGMNGIGHTHARLTGVGTNGTLE
jgi:hypothetical protein